GDSFISLDKSLDVFSVTFEEAKEVIAQKQKADAPISVYDGKEVTKGVGRFGPFIKWDNIFISVSKKYNFDSLSQQDIAALIEEKLKKESEKVVKEWPEEGIHIEKARWGRYHLIKGKTKVELSKDTDIEAFTLVDAQTLLAPKEKPKKATATKKAPAKTAAKKTAKK
ncbi:topoisomerase C-terminal repeat-containing protein, partial [Capnocytophaga gingivalis]